MLSRSRFLSLASRSNTRALTTLNTNQSIYVSSSVDPYFNLSVEDWLFRNKRNDRPLLLLYRDEPCIVIGRNQNPWKEVNLQSAALRGVPFIRRRSGGGTVYHDLGNTNYSLHVARSAFDRNASAKVIVRAVRSLGIDAEVNERNDICASGFKIYLSGSAYKLVNKRAYHHGTMLISTRLNLLGDLLHNSKETMITKGVASVRSPVANLQQYKADVDHDSFVRAAIASFQQEYNIHDLPQTVDENIVDELPAIREGISELKSWEWQYGQTPEFTYHVSRRFDWGEATADIQSRHGIVLSCEVECPGMEKGLLKSLDETLRGKKYGFLEDFNASDWQASDEHLLRLRGLWDWLKEETSS